MPLPLQHHSTTYQQQSGLLLLQQRQVHWSEPTYHQIAEGAIRTGRRQVHPNAEIFLAKHPRQRQLLEDEDRRIGAVDCPTFFITFSCAENWWPDLRRLLAQLEYHAGNKAEGDAIKANNFNEMSAAAKKVFPLSE